MTEEFVGIYIVYKVIDSFSWRLLSTEAITVDVVNDIISLSSQA
jgi:xanthosine utilization system XapX-like protein